MTYILAERVTLYYNEGPGTSRYAVLVNVQRAVADLYRAMHDWPRAQWEEKDGALPVEPFILSQ